MKATLLQAVCVCLCAFAGLGCQRTGSVAGRVTYATKPLVFGTVLFVDSEGLIHQGNIGDDGSYRVADVRIGEALVAVSSPNPTTPLVHKEGQRDGADAEESRRRAALKPRWFPIPRDYEDPNKSGLKYSVRAGTNSHDIELP